MKLNLTGVKAYNNRLLIIASNNSPNDIIKNRFAQENVNSIKLNFPVDINIEYSYSFTPQGAIDQIQKSLESNLPFAAALIDVSLLPENRSKEIIKEIWALEPRLELVLYTSDPLFNWHNFCHEMVKTDKIFSLVSNTDEIFVNQIIISRVQKWNMIMEANTNIQSLESKLSDQQEQLNNALLELDLKNKQIHQNNVMLEHVAAHDPLTDLPNRILFNDRLHQILTRSSRESLKFALCVFDINNFKDINEKLGQIMGDRILCEISKRVKNSLRESDTVARLGGDEFALILPGTDEKIAPKIIEKIINTCNKKIEINNHEISVNISLGYSMYPENGIDSTALIKSADVALYYAKRNKKSYVRYDKEEDSRRQYRIKLESELEKAIYAENLDLHYQAIIDLETNQICGVEALCRWLHPRSGLVPPEKFIAIAEENDSINPLSDWVIETALEQCAIWHRNNISLVMSINLSARYLLDATLPLRLKSRLNHYNISPEFIKLEITESTAMADPEHAFEMLSQFHKLGVRISIDDFGTGYSSFAYLKRLPIDELKIDRGFVMDMVQNLNNDVIVKSIIDLAHNLGLVVVAEGVETEDIYKKLQQYQCDLAQGYYMCKPKSISDINDWLLNSNWAERKSLPHIQSRKNKLA